MKLIADLNVNGNQLRDGNKNIGPVVEEITPVNQNEIDLAALRESILEGGKVPVNFTFEDFMTRLFVKVNAEIATNTTMNMRIMKSCFFSDIFFTTWPLIRSRVRVELDERTRDAKVDIEAEKTRTITTAIRIGERVSSIVGMMLS